MWRLTLITEWILVAELRNSLEGMVSEPLIESDEVVEAEVIESNDVRDTRNS